MSKLLNVLMYAIFFVLPLTSLIAGYSSLNNPPKEINGIKGYRTKLSMASQEAWDYANKRMGQLFLKNSTYMLALGLVAAIILLVTKVNYTNVTFSIAIVVIVVLQTLLMTLPMAKVEQELADEVYKVATESTYEEIDE